jgi:hypothetical protein
METNLKKSIIYVSILVFIAMFQIESFAQGKSEKSKEKKKSATSREISTEIEKELESQEVMDQEHEEMHKSDRHMDGKPLEKKKGKLKDDHHERMHGKEKGKMDGNEFGHIRSEEAKKKMMATHENMQKAQEAIKRSEEKIATAKVRLLQTESEGNISKEDLAAKREKIKEAEQKVAEAKNRLKAQHNQVHDKMMETKKLRKEKIKSAEEVETED